MRAKININPERIADFCHRHHIRKLALFGSVLRDDFRLDSDVDLLVTFRPKADWGLLDHAPMEEELGQLLGRRVDLLTRRSVERSKNPILRQAILAGAVPLFSSSSALTV